MHILVLHLFSPKIGSRFLQSIYPVSYQIIAAYFAEHRGFHFHFAKLHKLFFFPWRKLQTACLIKSASFPLQHRSLSRILNPKYWGKAPIKHTFKTLLLLVVETFVVIQQHSCVHISNGVI